VGSTEQKVNVRIIAATNKPLKELIEQGLFRKTFYRINTIHITLPPQREKEGVVLLIDYF
jgi:transcriptional regulator with PAS, ATPase and Fis domain